MIVSNATPLIAFARINQLDLLYQTAGNLIIPQAVAQELSVYGAGRPGSSAASLDWIKTQIVSDPSKIQYLLATLDQGEAEVIVLAQELASPLILMDELMGRRVAHMLGLKVIGSIGILIRAKQKHLIPAIKPLWDELLGEGLFYSHAFYQQILQEQGELP